MKKREELAFFDEDIVENNDEEGPRLRINEIAPTRLLRVTPR